MFEFVCSFLDALGGGTLEILGSVSVSGMYVSARKIAVIPGITLAAISVGSPDLETYSRSTGLILNLLRLTTSLRMST